ncbi:MAG: Co2+/Mg2+ efflux protein ApaG [Crocinitomicaceae bacterium]|nr:Co2+/Mg2+ efflux protein ApaG [Crocinitomicaceae bacterium]
MSVAITEGVEIRISVTFRSDLSNGESNSYFFNYEVFITNHNLFPIQLLHRNWHIFDSMHDISTVSGEGVIGEQPILRPHKSFTYMSGCELFSELGYMKGFYTFKNLSSEKIFRVEIPKFQLIYPPRLN